MRHRMMTAVLMFALTGLAFVGSPAARAQTQTAMNIEAARDAGKADAAMNAAYKKLMTALTLPQKAKLKKAQRAWLVFRDAEADLLSSGSEGGTMHPMEYSNDLQGITEQRTKDLKEAYRRFTTEGG